MPTPRIERETTITYNEEEDKALVWSASEHFQRRMERLGVEPYQRGKRDGEPADESRWYRVPKSWIKVRPPKKMNLTEEQRAASAARMAILHRNASTKNREPDPIAEDT